jgi:hypothetical protein
MPTSRKKSPQKKAMKPLTQKVDTGKPSWGGKLANATRRVKTLASSYRLRRPHRSFRLTRRRDYIRPLAIPGYWSFTTALWRIIWRNKRLFGGVVLFYGVLDSIFVGISSQDTYSQLNSLLTGGSDVFQGGIGAVGQVGIIVLSGITGSFSPQLSESQQIYGFVLSLLTWLTTVWLLRAILSGKKPRFRDALYNSGSPIVATGLVFIVLIIQLIPAALAILAISISISTNLVQAGLISMVVMIAALLLMILSIYWVTSTIFALVIVTLPGMYPWQAIRASGDIVIGRRIRILLRIIWLLFIDLLAWVIVVIPVVILDRLLKSAISWLDWLPLVPIAILVVSSFIVVWSSSYIYLLYRKAVEDGANPA